MCNKNFMLSAFLFPCSKTRGLCKSFLICLMVLLSCLLVSGCSSKEEKRESAANTRTGHFDEHTSGQEPADLPDTQSGNIDAGAGNIQSDTRPNKVIVLSARKTALEGMNSEDIERLNTTIAAANLRLEADLIFGDLQDHLSDPEDGIWNYLHQTGEIIIGYAFEDDIMKQKDSLGLSEEEFERQYGQPVYARSDYDAEKILTVLDELQDSIHNEKFRQNFVTISELVQEAVETHDVNCVINIYRILHDMDYYILRYGPEDVGKYVQDKSTIQKYYGVLEDYMGTPYYNTDGFLP